MIFVLILNTARHIQAFRCSHDCMREVTRPTDFPIDTMDTGRRTYQIHQKCLDITEPFYFFFCIDTIQAPYKSYENKHSPYMVRPKYMRAPRDFSVQTLFLPHDGFRQKTEHGPQAHIQRLRFFEMYIFALPRILTEV